MAQLYSELRKLPVDQFPHAVAVELRVFVELAINYAIGQRPDIQGKEDPNTSLAKRMKALAADMEGQNEINRDLKLVVDRIANSQRGLSAGTQTFNQYVHNQYVIPVPNELRSAWDELQPFLEKTLK